MLLLDLPSDLCNNIITYVDIPERRVLRATCNAMKSAVANSDFYVKRRWGNTIPAINFTWCTDKLMDVVFDEKLLILRGDLIKCNQFFIQRKLLFKRAFAQRISINVLNAKASDTIGVIELFMEGCVFKELHFEGSFNDKVRSFISNHRDVALNLSIRENFVDEELLFTLIKPSCILFQGLVEFPKPNKDLWKMDDAQLAELVKRGHSLQSVPVFLSQPETIFTVLKYIAAAENGQCSDLYISISYFDGFLKLLGIKRRRQRYFVEGRAVEGIRLLPDDVPQRPPVHEVNIDYEGTRITAKQFTVEPEYVFIRISNFHHFGEWKEDAFQWNTSGMEELKRQSKGELKSRAYLAHVDKIKQQRK